VTTPQKNAIVLVVVALVVAGMIYTGAKHSRRPAPIDDGMQGDLRGKDAPDFELKTLDGKKVKLSELRGKAVVVNFWATWCGPCKLEMPWLVDLQTKYADKGLVILGLSVDEGSSEKIASFAKDMGVNYPVLRSTDEVSNLYGGIDGLPTTFYVGRDGKVIEQAAGLVSKDVIEDDIKLALAHGVVPATASTDRELSNAQKDSKTKQ
jgi:thiol-disulfide isomerase/thioredoxin